MSARYEDGDDYGSGGPAEGQLSADSMVSDSMAKTLFRQDPPLRRRVGEKKLREHISAAWLALNEKRQRGQISEVTLRRRLARLDAWAAPRLSGRHVLMLAMEAERMYPTWIIDMPRLLALRYEELRVARLWSTLLNPEALSRFRIAIDAERELGGFDN